MAKLVLRQEYIDDLNDIYNYTFEQWSESKADNYYEKIKLACNRVAKNPNIGKKYNAINKNLLGIKCGKHIIFYKVISNNEIEVVRILHERMDLKSKFKE